MADPSFDFSTGYQPPLEYQSHAFVPMKYSPPPTTSEAPYWLLQTFYIGSIVVALLAVTASAGNLYAKSACLSTTNSTAASAFEVISYITIVVAVLASVFAAYALWRRMGSKQNTFGTEYDRSDKLKVDETDASIKGMSKLARSTEEKPTPMGAKPMGAKPQWTPSETVTLRLLISSDNETMN
jgi:hypothetical protein